MMRRNGLCWLVILLILLAAPALADEGQETWQPPPPMPDEFDWLQTTSGEWLKGEVIAMYDESLEFDSDEFDDQTLDWEDVQQVRSAQTMRVAFLDDVVATGKLLVDGDTVRVFGEQEWEYERSEVLSITPGGPKERNHWGGKVSAGLNYRSGNTDQTETNARLKIMRRTPKNRISFSYLGNFSETDGETIADNQRARAGWNHFISDRFYISPVFGEYYRDPFQNIGSRWTVATGVGYDVVDTSEITWSVEVGIGYQRTYFDDVVEGESAATDTPSLVVSTRYDNELTGWLDYFFDYRFFVVDQQSGSFTHHLITGFEFDLIGDDLDFNVSWVWDRTQNPRQNSDGSFPKKGDFRTLFGLGYKF